MKLNKSVFLAFGLLILVGSVLRVAGYAPQIAMGIFGAAVISAIRSASARASPMLAAMAAMKVSQPVQSGRSGKNAAIHGQA